MADIGEAARQTGRIHGTMVFLRSAERAITAAVETLGVVLVAALVIDVSLGVFTRYVLRDPLPWTDEAARYMLIWTAFLGAAVGVRRGSHYGILMILYKFPRPARRVAVFLIALGMAGFMFLLVRIGINLMMMANAQISPALSLRLSWIYAVIPLSGTLMLFYLALDMLDLATTGRAVLGTDTTLHHDEQ